MSECNYLNIYELKHKFLVGEVGQLLDRLNLLSRWPLDPESAQQLEHCHLDLQLGESLPDAHPVADYSLVASLISFQF